MKTTKLELPIKIVVYGTLIGSIVGYFYLPLAIHNYIFNVFLVSWGIDKVIAYYSGKEIRIGPVVKISVNASKYLRYIGFFVGTLLISIGFFNFFR